MNDETVAELGALRSRVYGPDADLHADPAALRRLDELEGLAGACRAAEVSGEVGALASAIDEPPSSFARIVLTPAAAASGEAPVPSPAEPEPSLGDSDDAEGGEAPAPPAHRWTHRRVAVAWAVSLALAVVVSASVSSALTWRVQADPREVAVLSLDPGAEWPEGLSEVPEGRIFTRFYGLMPYMANGWTDDPDTVCLGIVNAVDLETESQGYSTFGGCAAGAFPATVEFTVEASSTIGVQLPEELLAQFPEGTSLQFVLEGSRVIVLSEPPAHTTDEAQPTAGFDPARPESAPFR